MLTQIIIDIVDFERGNKLLNNLPEIVNPTQDTVVKMFKGCPVLGCYMLATPIFPTSAFVYLMSKPGGIASVDEVERVAAGAVCKCLLREFGIRVISHVIEMGGIRARTEPLSAAEIADLAEGSPVRCADPAPTRQIMAKIDDAQTKGTSLGGVFEVVALDVPVGLGTHVHRDRDWAAGEAHIFVMSDHGFGPLKKNFFVNRWLIKEGLMKLKPFISLRSRTVCKRSLTVGSLIKRFGLQNGEHIPGRLANWNITIPWVRCRPYHDLVDWSKTLAYATWRGGDEIIKVNLKGREPLGCVEMGKEYEGVRNRIIERLYALKDPDTGQQVIQKVYKREDIYNGPFVKDAPDLIYETGNWSYHPMADFFGEEVVMTSEKSFPALHHPDGILIMNGKHIKKSNRIQGASILDIAPTMFYLTGLPMGNGKEARDP